MIKDLFKRVVTLEQRTYQQTIWLEEAKEKIKTLEEEKTRRQSIYVLATISLANNYHNISSKAFILRDRYKRFCSNGLQENLLLILCVRMAFSLVFDSL